MKMKIANPNFKALYIGAFSMFALGACSTGGGVVLPSIEGETALARVCRLKAPDIIPATPYRSQGFMDHSGYGTASDAIARFLEGFETIEYVVTLEAINNGAALSPNNPSNWGLRPLTDQTGTLNLGIVERPHQGCAAFEAVVKTQGEPDAASFFTFTNFAPNPPRNWCINAFSYDERAMEFTLQVSQWASKEGDSTLYQKTELLRRNGQIVARRTQFWLTRPQFPIGVARVATGCDGRAISATIPEFVGRDGIALAPLRAPKLVPVSN